MAGVVDFIIDDLLPINVTAALAWRTCPRRGVVFKVHPHCLYVLIDTK